MEYDFSKFDFNEEELKAIKSIERAFKKAGSLGLVFYGKSSELIVYTSEVEKYVNEQYKHFGQSIEGDCLSPLPYYPLRGCITDSGADDYPCFKTEEDCFQYKLSTQNVD